MKERFLKAETDLKDQLALNQTKLAENQTLSLELRAADTEITGLHQEMSRVTKMKDLQSKKLKVGQIHFGTDLLLPFCFVHAMYDSLD